jgi:hypothetical protein
MRKVYNCVSKQTSPVVRVKLPISYRHKVDVCSKSLCSFVQNRLNPLVQRFSRALDLKRTPWPESSSEVYRPSDRLTLYPQKLALTLPTSGGRSVGTVRSLTQATEFCFKARISNTKRDAISPFCIKFPNTLLAS